MPSPAATALQRAARRAAAALVCIRAHDLGGMRCPGRFGACTPPLACGATGRRGARGRWRACALGPGPRNVRAHPPLCQLGQRDRRDRRLPSQRGQRPWHRRRYRWWRRRERREWRERRPQCFSAPHSSWRASTRGHCACRSSWRRRSGGAVDGGGGSACVASHGIPPDGPIGPIGGHAAASDALLGERPLPSCLPASVGGKSCACRTCACRAYCHSRGATATAVAPPPLYPHCHAAASIALLPPPLPCCRPHCPAAALNAMLPIYHRHASFCGLCWCARSALAPRSPPLIALPRPRRFVSGSADRSPIARRRFPNRSPISFNGHRSDGRRRRCVCSMASSHSHSSCLRCRYSSKSSPTPAPPGTTSMDVACAS